MSVNHPEYYGGKDNPYEAIKVIEAWGLGFCLGNAVKYISRAGKKDSAKLIEDLEKAGWYIRRVMITQDFDYYIPFPSAYNPFEVARAWGISNRLEGVLIGIVSSLSLNSSRELNRACELLHDEVESLKGANV